MDFGDDKIELGSLVPLENGWFLDTDTNTKFRLNEDGEAIGEDGTLLDEYDDEDYNRE